MLNDEETRSRFANTADWGLWSASYKCTRCGQRGAAVASNGINPLGVAACITCRPTINRLVRGIG